MDELEARYDALTAAQRGDAAAAAAPGAGINTFEADLITARQTLEDLRTAPPKVWDGTKQTFEAAFAAARGDVASVSGMLSH